jgi:hypothetical protein
MQHSVEFEFQWWRDAKGYQLLDTPHSVPSPAPPPEFRPRFIYPPRFVTPTPHSPDELRLFPLRIVRLGGDLVPYRPLDILDDIFRAYINLKPKPEAIYDFVDRYGPLTWSGLNENIGDYLSQVFNAKKDMSSYIYAGLSDDGTIRTVLAEAGIGIPGIIPKLIYDPATRTPKLRFHVPDLETALWLRLVVSFDRGTSLRRCEWEKCGDVFEAGAGTGRRADSKFCCDQHRIAYHSVHRTPRPATEKVPPRRRGRPRRAPT